MRNNEIVRLNVGGTKYTTVKSTLRKYPQSMLEAVFMESIPLKTDENGYYFIDWCGHIFEYILQFLRCGKLVLPEGFNELELLQTEADFYQIEDMISAVEHHKREVVVKKWDEAPLLLLCILKRLNGSEIFKLLKKSNDTEFEIIDDSFYRNGKYITVNEFRPHLVSDGWVLTGSKKLESIEASIFFALRGIEEKKFCYNPFWLNYSSAVVETWLRNLDVSY